MEQQSSGQPTIDKIKAAWGWVGLDPEEIIRENEFGNLLIRDTEGQYWRLCPEDTYCEVVALNHDELTQLLSDSEFIEDWNMDRLVCEAKNKLGTITGNRKYCLKIPGVLGGEYGGDNLGTIELEELIDFSGCLAYQIKDLPDGCQIKFDVV